jgi:hypothetical protein
MKIDLEASELDYVLGLLMHRPYREVQPMIDKIMIQVNDPKFQGQQLVVGPDPVPAQAPD